MKEIWKDIPGYEGLYQASSFGQIKSLGAVVHVGGKWCGPKTRRKREKILAQNKNIHGYKMVSLCKNGKVRVFTVHRLVMITFSQNIHGKPQIDHIDGDRANNNLNNLRWATPSENEKWKVLRLKQEKGGIIYKYKEGNMITRKVKCVETGDIFFSASEAARYIKCSRSRITEVCSGYKGAKTARGYHFEYIN